MDERPLPGITWAPMGANGKGNGKKQGAGPSEPPGHAEGGPHQRQGQGAAPRERGRGVEEPRAEAGGEESASRRAVPPEPAAPASDPAPAAASHAARSVRGPREARTAPPGPSRIARFEAKWTWLESRLITFVLIWADPRARRVGLPQRPLRVGRDDRGHRVPRADRRDCAGARRRAPGRAQPEERQRNLTLTGIAVWIFVVLVWRRARGVRRRRGGGARQGERRYFDNIKGWLQEGSTLTLLGGLRGLGTRLTLWLALLGGSLATAAGKHIHVDVVFRFSAQAARPLGRPELPRRLRRLLRGGLGLLRSHGDRVVRLAGRGRAAGARSTTPSTTSAARLPHPQADRLDLRTSRACSAGKRYDQWMSAAGWNEWVDGAGFE